MFAQSDPDTVTATLRAAGFDKIELTPATVTLLLGADVEDATDYLATSGVGRAVLETVPAEKRVSRDLRGWRGAGRARRRRGVCLDGAIWIITAARVA